MKDSRDPRMNEELEAWDAASQEALDRVEGMSEPLEKAEWALQHWDWSWVRYEFKDTLLKLIKELREARERIKELESNNPQTSVDTDQAG